MVVSRNAVWTLVLVRRDDAYRNWLRVLRPAGGLKFMTDISARRHSSDAWVIMISSENSLPISIMLNIGKRNFRSVWAVATFVILPMTFLCGTFFRVEKYPPLVASLVQILPLTHFAVSLRTIALNTGFPLVSLLVLAAYAVVLFALGLWVTFRVE